MINKILKKIRAKRANKKFTDLLRRREQYEIPEKHLEQYETPEKEVKL